MAKVYSKENDLKKQYEEARSKMIKAFGVCGICFVLWMANIIIFHTFNPLFVFPVFMGFGASGIYAKYLQNKVESLKAGVVGEANTQEFIKTLPDTYSAVTNAKISYEGKSSELDNVVIGPTGVFVIETKNHNGTISGSYLDDKLTQSKIGQGGTPYANQFYNPVKQVSTHVYRLSNLLKEKGINVWVQGIVYFSNAAADVEVEFDYNETPIFAKSNDGERELASYIDNYNCRAELDQNTVNKIVRALV